MPASAARSASEVKAQLPALISACAVLVLGISTHQLATPAPLGPLSRHMAVHIALMNVAAPICAAVLWLAWPAARKPASGAVLWTATIGQMVLLWVWHAPATHAAAMPSLVAQMLWHSSLFLSALLFWRALVPASGAGWQSIFALLVTGKLVCLLAVLLVFSPRLLYSRPPGAATKHAIAACRGVARPGRPAARGSPHARRMSAELCARRHHAGGTKPKRSRAEPPGRYTISTARPCASHGFFPTQPARANCRRDARRALPGSV